MSVFRELYVLATEAIEAEAKRKLDEIDAAKKRTPPITSIGPLDNTMSYVERLMRQRFDDATLTFQREARGGWSFHHQCSVCGKRHRLAVDEWEIARVIFGDKAAYVDLMLVKLDELYAQPCALELGHG